MMVFYKLSIFLETMLHSEVVSMASYLYLYSNSDLIFIS